MDPFALKRLGRTQLQLPALGMGGASLGNIFGGIDDQQADATMEAAWDAGIRFYDTSPWYGRGLSELRVGRGLYRRPREQVILSTKVGRVFRSPADPAAFAATPRSWEHGLHFEHQHDYSYEGVMRSYEDSLLRLGMNRIDMLVIHDLDIGNLGSEERVGAHLQQLATGGIRALEDLKKAGLIKAYGAGVNTLGTIPRFLDVVDLDFFLVALPYTLAEQPVLDREFPLLEQCGIGVVIGGLLGGLLGILAAGEAASHEVRAGIEYLVGTQLADGTWAEEPFTGTGFPRVFYLRYHGYPAYFPLWALARYRNLRRTNSRRVAYGM